MYQQIVIIGNLGKDPVSKTSQNGKQFTTISVAASRNLGQGQKETVWCAGTAWEKTAQYLVNYAQKGSLVMVTGRLTGDQFGSPRIWTDNNGNARAQFEVTISEVRILSGYKSGDQVQPQQHYGLGQMQTNEQYY